MMASPRTRTVLREARRRDENDNCFECGAPNTQWITVHYGIWLCLECAGKHRGLGVHLSFVRSVNMDKWKDIELEKVKVSGNRQCLEFLRSQPDYRCNWSFAEKWNSRAAALYRDKVSALAQGKPWSPETSSARNWIPAISGFIKNSQSFAAANSSLEEDFGVSQKDIVYQKDDYFGEHDPGMSKREGYQSYGYSPYKGKFTGFGNGPPRKDFQKPEFLENAMSSLSVGWAALSRGAAHAANFAKEGAYQLGQQASTRASVLAEQVKDGKLLNEVQSTVSTAASKAADMGWKGWQHVQSVFGDRRPSDYVSVSSMPSDRADLIQTGYVTESGDHNRISSRSSENDEWLSSFGTEVSGEKPATTPTSGRNSFNGGRTDATRQAAGNASSRAAAVNIPKVPMPNKAVRKKNDSDLIDFGVNDKKAPVKDWDAQAWDILNP